MIGFVYASSSGPKLANARQLFLQFHGPSTILLQSQSSRLTDILSSEEVNEIAKTPPGAVRAALKDSFVKEEARNSVDHELKKSEHSSTPQMSIASIGPDKKVRFEATKA